MKYHSFIGLDPPVGKHLDLLKQVLRPDPNVKQIDLCCGLGFGKTLLAIQAAALTLNYDGNQRVLFLEPDWDRINDIFLPTWIKHIHEDLYEIQVGKNRIIWKPTNSYLIFRPRVITGSKERSRGKFRGIEFSGVIDDETAIGFDLEQYQNTFARIRIDSPIRYYLTLSTPLVGSYGRFIMRGGNTLIRGRTRDNHYLLKRDPGYETRLRATMSRHQARRELDGELTALEDRIWKDANLEEAWPAGNRHDQFSCFNPEQPYWILCDLGSATGAYAVVQNTDAVYRGRRLFDGKVWVAVADFCPDSDANTERVFQKIKDHFGPKCAGVCAGRDVNTGSAADGLAPAYFVQRVFGNAPLYVCDESVYSKRIQGNRFEFMLCSAAGERRFCVARDFVALDPNSKRGIREMLDEDQWLPLEQQRESDVYPKNKEIKIQHIRDAILMGAAEIMSPPEWGYSNQRPKY